MVSRRRAAGYTLAVLVVFLTVLSVGLAVVLPKWSTAIRREQEEELIFRGLQYAEGIRVFQKRFGRYPVALEELLETKPRCIRQAWKEPVSTDGKWRPIRQGEPVPVAALQGGAIPGPGGSSLGGEPDPAGEAETPEETGDTEGGDGTPGGGEPVAAGPITGVRSRSKRASILTFLGQTRYSDWRFTTDLVQPGGPSLGVGPDASVSRPGGAAAGPVIPNANWIGRPLPGAPSTPGQLPASPGLPGSPQPRQPAADDGD
jgi:type II secretory pathway pseudopilin PulG